MAVITKTNNCEGGVDQDAVIAATSGGASGDAWALVSYPSGSIIYDQAASQHGTLGLTFTPASGQQCLARWTGFNNTTGVVRRYVTIVGLPASGNESFMSANTATGGGVIAVCVNAAGKYAIIDSAATTIATTTASYQAEDRIELSWTVGTAVNNGAYNFALYRGDSVSAVETKSSVTANLSNSGANTAWDRMIFGKTSTSTWVGVTSGDDFAAASGTTTFFGPPAINAAPIANAGADQSSISPGATVTLSGSGTDTDGTIVSYSWVQTDGDTVTLTNAGTATATFVAPSDPAGTTCIFRLTVTDDGGAVGTDTVAVAVLPYTTSIVTKTNNAEGGSNTTAVSIGNSGGTSGDAWTLVSAPSGSIIYDTASATHGTLGVKFTPASGQQCLVRWTGYNAVLGVLRRYITIDTLPASGTEGLSSVNTSTGGGVIALAINSAGKYVLFDCTGTTITGSITTASYTAGDRLELSWNISTGAYNFGLFRADATTATESKTGTANLNNSGANTAWDRVIFGKTSTSTWVGVTHGDDFAAASGTNTFFGPSSANFPPIANAGVDQYNVEPFDTVTLIGTASTDPDGTISSYTWSQVQGDTVTLSDVHATLPTFTAFADIAGTTMVFQLTVVDNLGASASDTVLVEILPHTIWRHTGGGVLVAAAATRKA